MSIEANLNRCFHFRWPMRVSTARPASCPLPPWDLSPGTDDYVHYIQFVPLPKVWLIHNDANQTLSCMNSPRQHSSLCWYCWLAPWMSHIRHTHSTRISLLRQIIVSLGDRSVSRDLSTNHKLKKSTISFDAFLSVTLLNLEKHMIGKTNGRSRKNSLTRRRWYLNLALDTR